MVRLAANLSFLFKEKPFLERFQAAAAAGFRAVEYMFPGDGVYTASAAEVAEQLEAHDLQQVLLNAPPGDWENGERGLGGIAQRETEFQKSIATGLSYCRRLGCPRMHVLAGMTAHGATEVRPSHPTSTVASARTTSTRRRRLHREQEVFARRLRWAAEQAAPHGVTLLVEVLNPRDFPGYLVPDAATALRLVQRAGHASVQLQLDAYHLHTTEGPELEATFRRLLPHAGHVQFANPPGRHEPGVGEVDFSRLCALLDELGYEGHVGMEYKPSTSTTVQSLAGWGEAHGLLVR